MAKAETTETDVWVKIPRSSQKGNLLLIRQYAESHSVHPHGLDKYKFPFDVTQPYDHSKVYKLGLCYDLLFLKDIDFTKPENKKLGKIYALGAASEFVVDDEKIILRAFYPQSLEDNRYSWHQRERLADDFLDFLIENGIDIAND